MRFSQTLLKRQAWQPRLKLPDTTPRVAAPSQLESLDFEPISYPQFPPRKSIPFSQRVGTGPTKVTLCHLLPPLPTTFLEGESILTWGQRPLIPAERAVGYHFPYRYYEISLTRSPIGLSSKIKHVIQSLGLFRRHQVVFRLVSARSAGQILRIKELVKVRLVNEIPVPIKSPTGFQVVGSLLA